MNEAFLLKEIECDKANIQTLINRLPYSESKGEYRSTTAAIKIGVKEIHNTKVLLEHQIFYADQKVRLPLFECTASPVSVLEQYEEMDSFFGDI